MCMHYVNHLRKNKQNAASVLNGILFYKFQI